MKKFLIYLYSITMFILAIVLIVFTFLSPLWLDDFQILSAILILSALPTVFILYMLGATSLPKKDKKDEKI